MGTVNQFSIEWQATMINTLCKQLERKTKQITQSKIKKLTHTNLKWCPKKKCLGISFKKEKDSKAPFKELEIKETGNIS